MRRWLVLFVVIVLALTPSLVLAQTNPTIENLTVQLWPEFDRPEMLVMYTFSLSEGSTLPTDLKIRVPANADLTAVAKDGADVPINVPYDAPIKEGDWIVVTLTITDLETYRVEYYAPIEKNGETREFDFVWQSDYAVRNLNVEFQQPSSATALQIVPLLPTISALANGNSYYRGEFAGVSANEIFSFSMSYNKEDEALMPVQISEMEDNLFSDSLPMVLVGVGVVMIVGGILYFVLSGRYSGKPIPRKRHSPSVSGGLQGVTYCHECGKRARSGDKFCRSCGAKLRL